MCLELVIGWFLEDVKLGVEEELWRGKKEEEKFGFCGFWLESEVRP